MFGNVDIDFTFYRSVSLDPTITLEQFVSNRVRSYVSFLTLICDDDYGKSLIKEICVLGAHASPVTDENFVDVTAPQVKLEPSAFTELSTRLDLTHSARVKRTIALNDALERELPRLNKKICFKRIDKKMLNDESVTNKIYDGRFRLDHHPNRSEALKLWYKALADKVPAFQERVKS